MDTDALPATAGIGRVAVRVRDLDAATAFYTDVVGFERLDPAAIAGGAPPPPTDGERAVLGAGGEPLLLLDGMPDARPPRPAEARCYHVAIRVPDRAALGAVVARLRERDLLDGAADHGVSEAIYLRDPADNGLEIYVDRPRAEWPVEDGQVLMDTLPLDLDDLTAIAPDDDAVELPDGTTIGHVHLEVTDLDATEAFYADALGMNVRQRMGEQALFLAAGDYHHHVGANTWQGRSAPAGAQSLGLAWFEVVVLDAAALDAAVDRLETGGFAVERSAEGETAADVAVTGPDGIRLRLRVDTSIAPPTGE